MPTPIKDLTQEKIGALTVKQLKRDEAHQLVKHKGLLIWECECQCGAIVERTTDQLARRRRVHCEHSTPRSFLFKTHGKRYLVDGVWLTRVEFSESYDIPLSTITARLQQGFTLEELRLRYRPQRRKRTSTTKVTHYLRFRQFELPLHGWAQVLEVPKRWLYRQCVLKAVPLDTVLRELKASRGQTIHVAKQVRAYIARQDGLTVLNPKPKGKYHQITFRGETDTLAGWARRLNLSYGRLHYQLTTKGLSLESLLESKHG